MAKEYAILMYLPSSGEWQAEGEQFDPTNDGDSWPWWSSATYTSASAALQVLNNDAAFEVEAAWTQTVGYQDAELPHPMPVYLLSRPARHPYQPDADAGGTEH